MKNSTKKILAVVLAVALVGGEAAWAQSLVKGTATAPLQATVAEQPVAKQEPLSGAGLTKDENVFVLLQSNGKVKKQIVSNWLHSDTGLSGICDVSTLRHIENIKTTVAPRQEGEMLYWDTPEQDVYYQGNTEQELPVALEITYKLGGESLSAQELAGKTGNVEICVHVKNNKTQQKIIDGTQRPIAPVFLTAVLINLPTDTFQNVKAPNGMLMSEAKNQMAAFATVPGLQESFDGLLDEELATMKDKLTDTFTVSAYAQNFALPSIMAVSACDSKIFEDGYDFQAEIDKLLSNVDDLLAATRTLQDGTAQLADAGVQFNENMHELHTNYNKFHKGLRKTRSGAQELDSGARALGNGIEMLAQQLQMLHEAAQSIPPQALAELQSSAQQAKACAYTPAELALLQQLLQLNLQQQATALTGQLAAAVDGAMQGCPMLDSGELDSGMPQFSKEDRAFVQKAITDAALHMMQTPEFAQKQAALATLQQKTGGMLQAAARALRAVQSVQKAPQLQRVLQKYPALAAMLQNPKALEKAVATLDSGVAALQSGASQLQNGTQKLEDSLAELTNASGKIKDAINTFHDATKELEDKTAQLRDGTDEFKTDGIEELNKKVNDLTANATQLLHIKDAVLEETRGFTSYTGSPAAANTSVRFVMKTDEITPFKEAAKAPEAAQNPPKLLEHIKALFHKK